MVAVPVGVMVAIYVSEFAHEQVSRYVRLALDVLNGVPSIVIGIFVYALLVAGSGQAAWKASFALAIIMLPLVSRATIEVLNLVPGSLREASFALGVAKWRTVLFVILPTVRGGILTGSTLAVARAAGETAPLLFTTSIFLNAVVTDPRQAMATLPFTIFVYSEAPDPHAERPGLGRRVHPHGLRARDAACWRASCSPAASASSRAADRVHRLVTRPSPDPQPTRNRHLVKLAPTHHKGE